jgi:hypothetical protein
MLGRNSYRVPNAYSLNLGAYKDFKLNERMNLQFRGEAYNLFNHSNYHLNYGGTDAEFGSPLRLKKASILDWVPSSAATCSLLCALLSNHRCKVQAIWGAD